jgi:hypothetical protein
MKMKAAPFIESFVSIYQTKWRQISEDNNFHIHRCENVKNRVLLKHSLLAAAASSVTPVQLQISGLIR